MTASLQRLKSRLEIIYVVIYFQENKKEII